MSLNIETKKAAVAEIGNAIAGAQTMVIAEYRGIGVASMPADSVLLGIMSTTISPSTTTQNRLPSSTSYNSLTARSTPYAPPSTPTTSLRCFLKPSRKSP